MQRVETIKRIKVALSSFFTLKQAYKTYSSIEGVRRQKIKKAGTIIGNVSKSWSSSVELAIKYGDLEEPLMLCNTLLADIHLNLVLFH
jgi:hypothetical protein